MNEAEEYLKVKEKALDPEGQNTMSRGEIVMDIVLSFIILALVVVWVWFKYGS
jgi:hypothetical protein